MKSIIELLKIVALRGLLSSLSLVSSIWIAHLLGQSDYGRYVYIIALVSFLTIPASLGLDRFLVREVAVYSSQKQWNYLAGLLRWSSLAVALASGLLLCVGNGVIWKTAWIEPQLRLPLSIGLFYIPISALKNLRMAAMKGLDRVALGLVPDSLIAPLLLIGAIALTQADKLPFPWIADSWIANSWIADSWIANSWIANSQIASLWTTDLTVVTSVVLQIAVLAITLIVGIVILRQTLQQILPSPVRESSYQYQTRQWIVTALPMMFFGVLQVVHGRIDLLMLGSLRSPDSVAVYSAVWQGTRYVSLILLSANSLLAPRIARLHAEKKRDALERMLIRYARLVTGLSAVAVFSLLIGGRAYLSLFGPSYDSGHLTLAILCVGQLVNAATGSVGILLNMTGHERMMLVSVGLSAGLNIGLNLYLIPKWGIEGAAIATVISLSFINAIKTLWAYRHLGIQVTCLGRIVRL